jgi:hypothetical protein
MAPITFELDSVSSEDRTDDSVSDLGDMNDDVVTPALPLNAEASGPKDPWLLRSGLRSDNP